MPNVRKKTISGTKSGFWQIPSRTVEDSPSSQPPLPVERRAFVRHFCDISATVDSWPAKIEDVSRGGLRLFLRRRYEPGTLLRVEALFPGEETPYTILALVVHVTSQPTGGWALGCAFTKELTDDELLTWLKESG